MEISIRQVSKTYEGVRAVNQVSLEIGSGENLILLGTSGSGKTTTLKMINRLIQPENGEILLGGRNIYSWPAPDLRKMIGYVIQQVGLFPHYTVYDNMAVVPRLLKWPESRTRERIDLLTGMFNLDTSLFSRYFKRRAGAASWTMPGFGSRSGNYSSRRTFWCLRSNYPAQGKKRFSENGKYAAKNHGDGHPRRSGSFRTRAKDLPDGPGAGAAGRNPF